MQMAPPLWRQVQRENFVRLGHLADFLELTEDQRSKLLAHHNFPLNLPRRLASKIAKGTLDDPLLRQFVPTVSETARLDGFAADPVGDLKAQKAPRLLHKYAGRALLVTTGACAMHCRYCFRQNFPYEEGDKALDAELAEIAADPSIREVILSGGDPLSLSDAALKGLIVRLKAIPHVTRLRFHTRFLMGIPERIDDSFLETMSHWPHPLFFVIHCNHPLELDNAVAAALASLKKAGVQLLNQSVLLKGVNDDVETLAALSERLIDRGVMPYYLHQLDRVAGSAHFEVPEERGLELIAALQARLPGYAVPKYVREIAGEPSKTHILSTV